MFSFRRHFNLLTFSIHELMPDCNRRAARTGTITGIPVHPVTPLLPSFSACFQVIYPETLFCHRSPVAWFNLLAFIVPLSPYENDNSPVSRCHVLTGLFRPVVHVSQASTSVYRSSPSKSPSLKPYSASFAFAAASHSSSSAPYTPSILSASWSRSPSSGSICQSRSYPIQMPLPVLASARRSTSHASLCAMTMGWMATVSLVWMSSAVNISFSFRGFVLLDGLMIRQAPYEINFGVSRFDYNIWLQM